MNSHRLTGTLAATAFVAGWFSASWLSPPAAVSQVRPPRPEVLRPSIPMPHITLEAVTAPETAPAGTRNPFLFAGGTEATRLLSGRAAVEFAEREPGRADDSAPSEAPALAPPPMWRVVGIATNETGAFTAVVSGGGDVWLLAVGDRLPDGSAIVEIDSAGLVLTGPAGDRITLRLP